MTLRVLVTGAAGYLGSILSEHLLDEGYRVTAVDNLMYGQQGPFHLCANDRFNFVCGDVRDERLMSSLVKDADVLIALAALVGVIATLFGVLLLAVPFVVPIHSLPSEV